MLKAAYELDEVWDSLQANGLRKRQESTPEKRTAPSYLSCTMDYKLYTMLEVCSFKNGREVRSIRKDAQGCQQRIGLKEDTGRRLHQCAATLARALDGPAGAALSLYSSAVAAFVERCAVRSL
jgi:hypothetical protein